MLKQKTSCHNKCFSLGFHVDFKKKYIDFHIWNWFIEFGNHDSCCLKEPHAKKLRKLEEKYIKESDAICAKDKDFHPLAI